MRSVIFLSMKIKGKSVNKLIKNIGSNMIFLRIITLTYTFDFHSLALNCFALVHSTWSNFDWSSSVCLAFLSTSSIQSNNNKKKHLQTLAVMQIKKMKKKTAVNSYLFVTFDSLRRSMRHLVGVRFLVRFRL